MHTCIVIYAHRKLSFSTVREGRKREQQVLPVQEWIHSFIGTYYVYTKFNCERCPLTKDHPFRRHETFDVPPKMASVMWVLLFVHHHSVVGMHLPLVGSSRKMTLGILTSCRAIQSLFF